MGDQYIGEVRFIAFNFPPRGWAFCNGQILPINTNQALFSILGTTYGGDGRTHSRFRICKAEFRCIGGRDRGFHRSISDRLAAKWRIR